MPERRGEKGTLKQLKKNNKPIHIQGKKEVTDNLNNSNFVIPCSLFDILKQWKH